MTGSGLFDIIGYLLTGLCAMDITKENIEKYLLDKNGNPSRMKKKQNAEFFQAALALNPHEDENTSLYLTYKGVECRRCNLCGSPMKIANFKIGWKETAHWCSIKCRDADPDYIEHHRKTLEKIDHAARMAKQRETVKQRYGVDHIAKTDHFKTRMKEFHATVDHAAMREKYKQTCMERYGVEHYYQSAELKAKNASYQNDPEYQKARVEKMKETNRALYGVENYSQTDEWKQWAAGNFPEWEEKRKATCLEKYGVEYWTQTDEARRILSGSMTPEQRAVAIEKKRETCLERYGVTDYSKTDEYKERVKVTCLEKYGVEWWSRSEEGRRAIREGHTPEGIAAGIEKRKATCLEKYGVESCMQSEEVMEKRKATCMEKYGAPFYFMSEQYKEWLSSDESRITKPEYAIHELISELGLVAQAHNRTVLPSGKEIDIWVEEKRVGFEVNGVYWHSSWDHESDKIAKKRHLEKTNWAKEAGIRLVHFTDVEIETKWPIVSSMIKSILGKSDRHIYARKCEVKMIDYATGHSFLNETHIQGGAPCAIWIGLYHGGELVSVMGFNKARFDKNYDWELVRFASALNTTVVGGFSKCLKAFRELHSGTVVSYADYSRSNGDVYRKNGFIEKGLSHPSYRWVKGNQLYNRHSFMHRNLAKMLGEENYNPEETEAVNCWRNGYRRIWDCGQIKFVLE